MPPGDLDGYLVRSFGGGCPNAAGVRPVAGTVGAPRLGNAGFVATLRSARASSTCAAFIDFGLNPQPIGVPTSPIPVTQRIITNFYTAKRMLHALTMTVQRHEATFGVLEIDVQKRVRPGLVAGAGAPQQQQPPQE